MPLAVCVCGWYLREYDHLYRTLYKLHHLEDVPVHVIAHRPTAYLEVIGIPYTLRGNKGLEFGAYDHYLQEKWDGKSDVVFMHDDMVIGPHIRDYVINPPEKTWGAFKDAKCDQAYVFQNRHQDVVNDGKHGRMIYMSSRCCQFYKDRGGIPHDPANEGHTEGPAPEGVQRYNHAIEEYDKVLDQARKSGMKVREVMYLPWVSMAHRGTIKT